MTTSKSCHSTCKGFSLIEVVLAIGIFMVTILALVGLLGPTLKSVDEVEQTDAITSVVNSLNAFLHQSQDIAPNASKFDAIFRAVESNGFATIFVFQSYLDPDSTDTELKIGFHNETDIDPLAGIQASDFKDSSESAPKVAGSIYRVLLSPSSVLPAVYLEPAGPTAVRNATTQVYTLTTNTPDPPGYPEGYFAMEVRIFAEEYSDAFMDKLNATALSLLTEYADVEPIFTYNAAVVR